MKKSNWDAFNCNLHEAIDNFNNIDEIEEYISTSIINSSRQAIPPKKRKCKRKEVPCWNNTTRLLISDKRKLLKKFERNMTSENLAHYLRIKSKLRKEVRKSKKRTWIEFSRTINIQ